MSNKNLLRVALGVFLIRLALALLPSFAVDMNAWLGWAHRLAAGGTAQFYSDLVWTQYTPGYLYWLLVVGKLGWVDPLMIKIPTILADMTTGWLIWKILRKKSGRSALVLPILYVLNPVVIFDGSIWGQIDGVLTLLMLGSTYFLVEKKNYWASYLLGAVALLVKPQAVAMMPGLLLLTWVRLGLGATLKGCVLMGVSVILGFVPFFPDQPLGGMLGLIQKMGESYPFTSLFAFNSWSFVGMWLDDAIMSYGLSYFQWGVLGVGTANLIWIGRYYKQLDKREVAYWLMAGLCLSFFLFPTRVHERYLFPYFAFATIYAGLTRGKLWYGLLGVMSVLYTANLYVPYSHYESVANSLKNPALEQLILSYDKVVALLFLGGWGLMVGGEKMRRYFQVGKTLKRVSQ